MALMKNIFIVLFVAATMAMPFASAQGILGGLLGLIRINGTVFCTLDGNMGAAGTATPVFANAGVQLQCGGNVMSSTTTNAAGVFTILLDPLQNLISSLLNNCNIAVTTPLSTCNAQLPSVGGLVSRLLFSGNTLLGGLLSLTNLVPGVFRFVPILNN